MLSLDLFAALFPKRHYEQYKQSLIRHLDRLVPVAHDEVISLKDVPTLPIRLREIEIHEGDEVAADDLPPILDSSAPMEVWGIPFVSSRVVVLGERGSGKSVMLRYLAVAFAGDRVSSEVVTKWTFLRQETPVSFFMPLYVNLRDFAAQSDPLAKYLEKVCAQHHFPRAGGFLQQRLQNGECLLLLDGLEGVPADRQEWVRGQINALSREYGKRNQFIVTSELAGYRHDLPGFAVVQLLGLSDEGIEEFVLQRFKNRREQISGLMGLMEWTPGLHSLAANPFFLSAITAVYSQDWQPQPARANVIYEQCIWRLLDEGLEYARRYGQKAFSRDDLFLLLQKLAYDLHSAGRTSLPRQEFMAFSERVLASPIEPETEERLLGVLHRSGLWVRRSKIAFGFGQIAFQEYLAAKEVLARREGDALLARVGDPWWREVIIMFSGLVDSPALIRACAKFEADPEQAILVAARCLSEAELTESETELALRRELFYKLSKFFLEENAPRWRLAALAIASMEHKMTWEAFTGLLKDQQENIRARAAIALGRIGEDWALAPLIEALDDPSTEVRAKSAWALGRLGDEKAVPRLVDKLADSSLLVSEAAAEALGTIGEPAVRPLLFALRAKEAQMRQMAAKALILIGKPVAIPLIEVTGKKSWGKDARLQAIAALGEIGSDQAIEPLINLIYEPDADLSMAAAKALGRIGQPATRPLIDALAKRPLGTVDVMPQVVEALVAIGEPAVEDLLKALGDLRPEIRDAAERSLTGIGSAAIHHIIAALPQEPLTVQRRLARILGEIGDKSAVDTLIELLRDSDPSVQTRIVQALGRIGDTRAVAPLLNLMQQEKGDDTARRSAAHALGAIGNGAAVDSLVTALHDPLLRGAAASALRDIGGPAVESLIRFVYDCENEEARQLVVQILGDIGRGTSMDKPTFPDLAHTFHYLITQRGTYGPDELLLRLQNLIWWSEGAELYRAFSNARALRYVPSLADIPRYGDLLAWARGSRDWFRPPLRDILRGLNDITENIKLYLANRHHGGREALLSSVDRINNELQVIVDSKLLPFEADAFRPVVDQWKRLLDEAIKQMRGRAELRFEVTAEQVLLESATSPAPVTFILRNMGDSVARNLSVSLTAGRRDGVQIVGETVRHLDPLGSGMQREIRFLLQPQGANEATLTLEAIYDDDEGEHHRSPFTTRIRFGTIGKYVPIPESPYVPGKPVKTPQMFFGRREVLDWITQNLGGAYQQNILVLHGERRVGKTSILYQLQNTPPTPRHICIFFTFELASPTSVHKLLYDMAYELHRGLKRHQISIPKPVLDDYKGDPESRFRQFCEELGSYIGDKVVVLMMDEFGILIEKIHEGMLSTDTLNYLRGIIQENESLSFIFVGADPVRNMLRDERSILFNMARVYKIGYLKASEAEQLIRTPVAGYLDYADPVVRKIVEITACHPYFIQCICDDLVKLAQREKKNYINLSDLDLVLQKTIEDATGNIWKSIYLELSENEKRTLAALGELTDEQTVYVTSDRISEALEKHDLPIPKSDLLQALRQLCERDLAVEERIGQRLAYGFKMGLVRMWLRANEILIRLKEERSP